MMAMSKSKNFNPMHYESKGTKYAVHLRYADAAPYNGAMWVAIHIGCYYKGLTWLSEMAEHLKKCIPFEYEMDHGGPEVFILDGQCYKNIPSVQFYIRFKISDEEAVAALNKAEFFCGLEPTK
jgi:hypothetical protein